MKVESKVPLIILFSFHWTFSTTILSFLSWGNLEPHTAFKMWSNHEFTQQHKDALFSVPFQIPAYSLFFWTLLSTEVRFSQKHIVIPRFCSCRVLVSLELIILYLKLRCSSPLCITFIYPECNLPFYCLVIQAYKALLQFFSGLFILKSLKSLVSSEGSHLSAQLLFQVTSEYVEQDQAQIATAVHLWPLYYKYGTLTATPCAPSLTSYSCQDVWSYAITA